MKARKIENGIHQGRILISNDEINWLIAATPIKQTVHNISLWKYNNSIEIDILKEKWVHPHLLKQFKEEVKKLLVDSK